MTTNTAQSVQPQAIPTFPGSPLVGSATALMKDPMSILTRATLDYFPVVRLVLPGAADAYVPSDARIVEHMLVGNVKNYDKRARGFEMLRKIVGEGLVTSAGDFWKRQRRIAQPAFHKERIARFGEAMVRASMDLVDGWKTGKPLDLAEAFNRVTLRLVGETLLSADITATTDATRDAMAVALEHLVRRSLNPFSLPEWVPTRENFAFKKALATLDDIVFTVIKDRRAGKLTSHDLLAMLMEARDPETGEGMTDGQLRDEVMTIMLAGHETTASALAWTAVLLGQNPQVEARLVQELDSVLGGRAPTIDDVSKLQYTGMVFKEAMRLYPPVWSIGRRVVEEDLVQGVLFPKDSHIFLCPYALHRHPKYWKDPEVFEPMRWAPEAPQPEKGTYLPFNIGQRKCIGDVFATIEAQLILAIIYSRTKVELVPGHPIEPHALLTLRPKHGVMVTTTPRS
jgi:cytochrome P450